MVRHSILYLSSSRLIQESWKISHTYTHKFLSLILSVFICFKKVQILVCFSTQINEFCWLTWEITGRFKLATWKVSWTEKRRWCGRDRRGRHRIWFGGEYMSLKVEFIPCLSRESRDYSLSGCCLDAVWMPYSPVDAVRAEILCVLD